MADESVTVSNSPASSNPDYNVAVDTIGGKEYQRVKLDLGADGLTDPVVGSVSTTLKDSTGDSCMDDANNAVRVNIIAGGSGGGDVNLQDGAGNDVSSSITYENADRSLNTFPNFGYYPVDGQTAEAGSTASVINATGHTARIGYILQFNGFADCETDWSHISAVTANTITLQRALHVAPANGDGFIIWKPAFLQVHQTQDGDQIRNALFVSQSINDSFNNYIVDGVDKTKKVTVFDYTNSNPLAVRLTDTAGDYVSAGGGSTRTPFNSFAEDAAVASTTETTLVTYTPSGVTANIQGIVVTGQAAGRFKVKVAGTTKSIVRTTAAKMTEQLFFLDGTLTATTGQAVTVTGFHEETANQALAANVFGFTS